MTELELVEVLNRFSTDEITPNLFTYIGVTIITSLLSCIGVVLLTGAKKHTEISVLNARLKETISQLEQQTEAVKTIEAEISNQSWVEQQRWLFRKELYLAIIELLIKARENSLILDDMVNSISNFYFDEYSDLHEDSQYKVWEIAAKETLINCHEFVDKNIEPISKEVALLINKQGRLFLSTKVLNILSEFFNSKNTWHDKKLGENRNSVAGTATPDYYPEMPSEVDYLTHYSAAAKSAYKMIIIEARKDLKIDLSLNQKNN